MEPPRVVAHVTWLDAGIAGTTWDQREDVEREAREITGTAIHSAGLLLDQDGDCVTLACGFNPNNGDVNLVMAIPKRSIVSMNVWQPERSPEP